MAIRKKEYRSLEDFEADEQYKGTWELVTVVNKSNGAVHRLFGSLTSDRRFAGWMDEIIESARNGYWEDAERYWDPQKQCSVYTGGYFWRIEEVEAGYYICVNVPKGEVNEGCNNYD